MLVDVLSILGLNVTVAALGAGELLLIVATDSKRAELTIDAKPPIVTFAENLVEEALSAVVGLSVEAELLSGVLIGVPEEEDVVLDVIDVTV